MNSVSEVEYIEWKNSTIIYFAIEHSYKWSLNIVYLVGLVISINLWLWCANRNVQTIEQSSRNPQIGQVAVMAEFNSNLLPGNISVNYQANFSMIYLNEVLKRPQTSHYVIILRVSVHPLETAFPTPRPALGTQAVRSFQH